MLPEYDVLAALTSSLPTLLAMVAAVLFHHWSESRTVSTTLALG